MPSMKMIVCRLAPRLAVALVALTVAACALDKQEAPALSGPSEFGLALTMTASPDQLPRDGRSQSVVTVTVRDSQGRPVSGQRVAVSLPVNAPAGAFLSQSEVTTGSSGQASFTVTAPTSGSLGSIVITAIPVGTNSTNATARTVTISATPTNGSAPVAAFTFSPATPEIGQTVTFDASTTTDEGVLCTNCTFAWDFGGDGTASGRVVTHTFFSAGPFVVRLVATDSAGTSGAAFQTTVNVTAITVPTVSFVAVPASPSAGQATTFTATATPSANHRISSYTWNWGDGSGDNTTSSPSIQHTFANQGRFFVTVTVRDDLGQSSSTSNNIVVQSGLTASFTSSQVPPNGNHTMNFDASASVSNTGTKITDYAWDFGDGGANNGSSATVQHTYGVAGTYTVRLTITDDKGRTATTTASVTVL